MGNDTLLNLLTAFSATANSAGVTTTTVGGAGGTSGATPGNCGTGAGGFRAGNSCGHQHIKGIPHGFQTVMHLPATPPATGHTEGKGAWAEKRERANVKLPVTKWTPETGHVFVGHVERDATLPGDSVAPFRAYDVKGNHVGTFHSAGMPSAMAQQKAERAVLDAHRKMTMTPGQKAVEAAKHAAAKAEGTALKHKLSEGFDGPPQAGA